MKRKLFVSLIISVLLAIFLELFFVFLQYFSFDNMGFTKIVVSEKSVYPENVASLISYETDGSALIVKGTDPGICLNTDGEGLISEVIINFFSITDEDYTIQCFYEAGGEYTEENSVRGVCLAGSKKYTCSIPEGKYHSVRIDIDGSYIPVDSILVSTKEMVIDIEPNVNRLIRPLCVATAVFLLISVCLWTNILHNFLLLFERIIEWEKRKGYKRQWWIIVIIAVFLAFVLEIIQLNTQPNSYHYVVSDKTNADEQTVFICNDAVENLERYELTEHGLRVTGNDPQILIDTADKESFSWVYFYFREKTESETDIRVYYTLDGVLTEENAKSSICPSGVDYWAIEIPEGQYEYIRADLDGEVIPLDRISVGKTVATRVIDAGSIHPIRIMVVSCGLFVLFFWMAWNCALFRLYETVCCILNIIRHNGKRIWLYIGAFTLIVGISIVICRIVYCVNQMTIKWPVIIFSVFVGFFVASMLMFRKILAYRPEYIFLVLSLCIGSLFCFFVPHTGLNSWDEDFHYRQALISSYVDEARITPQDTLTIERTTPQNWDLSYGIKDVCNDMDILYQAGAERTTDHVAVKCIPETFNGMGLFIGRALGLRYYRIHALGRFFGLLAYTIAGFFAIRKLKSGKMIASAVLLMPTAVFIASSYNYDCYLTVFSALGICYYISQWQNFNEKMSLTDAMIMVGSITFGCLPKMVYFPLIWILLLLPKEKFKDSKHRLLFVLSVFAMTVVLFSVTMLPGLVRGADFTDIRGGSDVNAKGQVLNILQNPIAYMGVLYNFFRTEYFNFDKSYNVLTNLAYNGVAPHFTVYLILLFVVAFTDKNDSDGLLSSHIVARVGAVFLAILSLVFAITAMYIEFTPVGSSTVNGAQFRYMIPAFVPILLHLGSAKIDNKMNRTWYNGIVFAVIAYVGFAAVYYGVISHYY